MAEPYGLLVGIGAVDPMFLDFLAVSLPETTGLDFRVHRRAIPSDPAFDPVRKQWNAARILAELEGLSEGVRALKVLGVADLDLFIPILTFVFGLAHLGARTAVVSIHRLRQEFYGLPPDPDLVLRRLEAESVHEIGHTLGLAHCPRHDCVMHYSNVVEQVDLKSARFCPLCRTRIARFP